MTYLVLFHSSVWRLRRNHSNGKTGQAVPEGPTTYHQSSEIPPRLNPIWIILPTGTTEHARRERRGVKSDRLFRKTQGGLGIVWGKVKRKEKKQARGKEKEMQEGQNKGRRRGWRIEKKWRSRLICFFSSERASGWILDPELAPLLGGDWLVY